MKLSDSLQEGAVVGFIGTNGFNGIPEANIYPPGYFTDPRWTQFYSAGYSLHKSGQAVNQFTINDEVRRLGLDAKLRETMGDNWESWISSADGSLAFFPASVAGCLKEIRQMAGRREGAKICAQVTGGEIDIAEARERLAAIIEGSQEDSHAATLAARQFDPENPPAKARAIYEMSLRRIGSPGNVVGLAAKAKQGKTALVGGFIAAATGRDGDTLGIDSQNHEGHALIHFDSEQSPADHHLVVATALFRVKLIKCPPWLRSYRVVDVPMRHRFELLEFALKLGKKECGGIHSVILDGIADFIADPNDTAEANGAVERLHALAVKYDTGIVCVLHINPGSETNKIRGHLGSQLERKAETNLIVRKDEDGTSVVYTTTSRHAYIPEQDGPRFRWDEKAMMHVSCDTERTEKTTAIAVRLKSIAAAVFTTAMRYTDAIEEIKEREGVEKRQAETLFSQMNKAGIIRKNTAGLWEGKA